jgi:hypothetical protein
MENNSNKICPFTLLLCKKESMPGENPCALYDEKRECCGLLPLPKQFLIKENGEIIDV